MRLLVLTELFLPTKGGTAVWAAEVYARLGGREIHLVTADVPGAAEFDRTHPNSVHRLKLQRVRWLRPESLAMYARLFFCALRLATRHRFEAVHAFRALPEGAVAWAVARLVFRPLVIYAHGEELTTWGCGRKFKAMRFFLRRADTVVANSEHTQASLVGMGVDARRIAVIHPGVDLAVFRPDLDSTGLRESHGIAPDTLVVFSVGRLARRKGFDQVIRAVARLRAEGLPVHYVIGGIGEDATHLDRVIAELGMTGHVTRLGAVSDADLPRWHHTSTVFAMPNRDIDGDSEGFGMVFIEAAACGKTCLAGRDGGTGSAVQHEQTGLRVDGASLDAVADGLRSLLTNPAQRDTLARQALARARAEFGWQCVADLTRHQLDKRLKRKA